MRYYEVHMKELIRYEKIVFKLKARIWRLEYKKNGINLWLFLLSIGYCDLKKKNIGILNDSCDWQKYIDFKFEV